MDAYLFLTIRTDMKSRQYADIIDVRGPNHPSPYGSDDDRRSSVVIKVTDVPDAKAAIIKQRLLEPLTDTGPEGVIIQFRKLYLFGSFRDSADKGRTAINQYIANHYPALAAALAPYINDRTVQPADEIPTVSWTGLRNAVSYWMAGRLADPDTEIEA